MVVVGCIFGLVVRVECWSGRMVVVGCIFGLVGRV